MDWTWWRHHMETFSAFLAICAWNSPHKGQRHRALMFSLISSWINGWVNNGEAGDLRRHQAHCDVIVMNASLGMDISLTLAHWKGLLGNDEIDGIVQKCSKSSASAMELLQSCTKPSKCRPTKHNEVRTKWATFCKRQFQMQFLGTKYQKFDYNFMSLASCKHFSTFSVLAVEIL